MSAINKVTLKGELRKMPVWGALPSGAPACRLVVVTEAVDRDEQTGRTHRSTDCHLVVLEGKRADSVRKGIAKGDEVYVEGRLKTRKWTDRQGIVRYCTEVVADSVTVFPKVCATSTSITAEEVDAWRAEFEDATARYAAMEEAKAEVLRQHRTAKDASAKRRALL